MEESREARNTTLGASSANAHKYTHHSSCTKGTTAIIPARSKSMVIMVRRRSQRFTSLAASVPPNAAGMSRKAKMPPTAAAESLR